MKKDLAIRRAGFQDMVESGDMTQADCGEWEASQEEILAGLRSGTLEGRAVSAICFGPVTGE